MKKETINTQIDVEVWVPATPTYLVDANRGTQQHISNFSKSDLKKIGQAWTDELIKRANIL